MRYICAVIFFVGLVLFSTAQRNTYVLVINYDHRGHAYQLPHHSMRNNNNPLSSNQKNFRFKQNPLKSDKTVLNQQQQILEKLKKLLTADMDEDMKQPSQAAILARQRPFTLTSPGPIFLRCLENCPTTSQYNPVCGSDYQTYHNEFKLQCAVRCGKNVKVNAFGVCPLDF